MFVSRHYAEKRLGAENQEPPVPSAEMFTSALSVLAHTMPQSHRDLLLIHYRAPNHEITARELAAALSYKNHQAANLQHGKLAGKVRSLLGLRGEGVNLNLFTTYVLPGEKDNVALILTMRPELVQALERLGWT